jgi:hypothetical protein
LTTKRETDTTDKILCIVSPLDRIGAADFAGKESLSLMQRIKTWVSKHIIEDVPEDIAACEFCREPTCSKEKWEGCEIRNVQAAVTRMRD